MAALAFVCRCVLVRRGAAAADLPARHAHAQMYPAASDLQALLTAVDLVRQRSHFDPVEVVADGVACRHSVSSRCDVTLASRGRVSDCEGDREIARVVGPPRLDPEPGSAGIELELLAAEFRADLDSQPLALLERHVEVETRDRDRVRLGRAGADVHPLLFGIPARLVDEAP